MQKITAVKAKVWHWQGDVVEPRASCCANATDVLGETGDAMSCFRFHQWLTCEIETAGGYVGIGNAALVPKLVKQAIDEYYAPLVIGHDPFDYAYLWEKMYRKTLPWGRKGVGMTAISAIDIAIWDLMGKINNKPVYKLLGGQTKAKIPVYYSKLYADNIDAMQKEAEQALKHNYSAYKSRFGLGPKDGKWGMNQNIKQVAALREVLGYDKDLMLEAYMGWNVDYAKRIIPQLVKFEPRWLEEPVIADDIYGYAQLNRGPIPISGGEHESSLFGFRQLLELEAVSVIQYDTNRVGGITAAQKINALAEAYQVPVIPHAGQSHNFHLIMANFNCPLAEYFPMHDVEIGNELFYYIFDGEPVAKNGFIELNMHKAGFGIDIMDTYREHFMITE